MDKAYAIDFLKRLRQNERLQKATPCFLCITPDDLPEAREILHNNGFKWLSGRPLTSDHVDQKYRNDTRQGHSKGLLLLDDGRVCAEYTVNYKPCALQNGLQVLRNTSQNTHNYTGILDLI